MTDEQLPDIVYIDGPNWHLDATRGEPYVKKSEYDRLTAECAKMLNESEFAHNRHTNALIERHSKQLQQLKAERDAAMAGRVKVGTLLQSAGDVISQPSTQEAIARIIEPSAWKQFDLAMRPYIENRGARQDENPWYQLTWRLGIRTPNQCRDWLLNAKYDGSVHNTFVLHVRENLEKSDMIMGVLHTLAAMQKGVRHD